MGVSTPVSGTAAKAHGRRGRAGLKNKKVTLFSRGGAEAAMLSMLSTQRRAIVASCGGLVILLS